MTDPQVREVKAAGIRTVYYERGLGPVLVLVHGMFGDYTDWETVLEPLSQNFRVIAPDLPGFGDSAKPDVEYDEELFVRWLHAFLDALGVRETVLVGNSFGGEVAVLYALAHPEKVRQMVLVSSGGLRFYDEDERALLREKFSVANLKVLTPEIHEWIFRPIFTEKGAAWRRYLDKQNAKLARADMAEYAVSLHRSMVLAFTLYFEEELGQLKMPVLLVWGDQDIVFPIPLAERTLARLQRGDLVILERAGHAPQLENPEGFVRALQRFVEETAFVDARRTGHRAV